MKKRPELPASFVLDNIVVAVWCVGRGVVRVRAVGAPCFCRSLDQRAFCRCKMVSLLGAESGVDNGVAIT